MAHEYEDGEMTLKRMEFFGQSYRNYKLKNDEEIRKKGISEAFARRLQELERIKRVRAAIDIQRVLRGYWKRKSLRDFLAEQLICIDQHRIQVVVPDVGGAFGVKTNLYPEELAVAAISIRLGTAVRWIEDRMEHLLSACHARENDETVTIHANRDGEILALEAEYLVDGGAYSMLPSTSAIEANMAANVMPGPYRIRNYRATAMSACTNKAPTGPYRGVGRPAACFAMERTLDELAHVLGIEPHALRRRNLIPTDAFPYVSATGLVYDTGNYPPMMDTAVHALGHAHVRAAQQAAPADARERIGIGYAWYVEQTAHTAKEFFARGQIV